MTTPKNGEAPDALGTLGTIIDGRQKRDAIHIAVEPVIAACTLTPGMHVGFVEGGVGISEDTVGIVDPFLRHLVKKGQRFWLFVYPRKIESLRHVWTHPAFADEPEDPAAPVVASASEAWIREYASEIDVTYNALMSHATDYVSSGDYWCSGGDFEGLCLREAFWDHYQQVTGTVVPENRRDSFFTCSC